MEGVSQRILVSVDGGLKDQRCRWWRSTIHQKRVDGLFEITLLANNESDQRVVELQ